MRPLLPLVVAMVVSIAGCGGGDTPGSPTTPSASPAGTWSGVIRDPVSGDGTARLSIAEDARGSLTGTWSTTFANGDSFSGPALASLVGTNRLAITLYVDPPPSCAGGSGTGGSELLGYTLINVVVTTNRLTAAAGRLTCSGPSLSFGTVDLSKQ